MKQKSGFSKYNAVIVIFTLVLSVSLSPKVFTLSGFHCIFLWFRSSSLDDLQWVTSASEMAPNDLNQPNSKMSNFNQPNSKMLNFSQPNSKQINYRSNTLPCEGRESRRRSPVSRPNGVASQQRHSCYEPRQVSGKHIVNWQWMTQ
jgi:hypothetical protein